ncbi:MAG: nucleotidyltransferase family protein [Anaerolineaceae bacterium]|nr:nucleotidyltransferase family protein [Anaerolineaceae bacterium]
MNAIVTAGGTPQPEEALYAYTQGRAKAVLDFNGKPMVQWVLDALSGSTLIDRVVLVGLPAFVQLACSHPITYLDSAGSIIGNIQAGVQELITGTSPEDHALVVASDIPAIRPDIVDWLVHCVEESNFDIYYSIVERFNMERAFPGSKRTYAHLKDGEFCGGDMHAVRLGAALQDNPAWHRILEARKNPLKQAQLIGFDTLFLLKLRLLTIQRAERMISNRLCIRGKALICPYPETGMDVDKPFQLEMLRQELAKKGGK